MALGKKSQQYKNENFKDSAEEDSSADLIEAEAKSILEAASDEEAESEGGLNPLFDEKVEVKLPASKESRPPSKREEAEYCFVACIKDCATPPLIGSFNWRDTGVAFKRDNTAKIPKAAAEMLSEMRLVVIHKYYNA